MPGTPNSPSRRHPQAAASIAAVERDTGFSKDTLRVWERRYGFPLPLRLPTGDRAYPWEQVEKLRVLKRLVDAGHRPSRVVPLALAELQALSQGLAPPAALAAAEPAGAQEWRSHLALIRSHDAARLRSALNRHLSRVGVARFVTEVVSPLNAAVGQAWLRGQMEIFEEHLYSEALQVVLRGAVASVPEPADGDALRVLLTTLPGEPHGLGLLMAEALLTLEGCRCTSLGPQTPLRDIVAAVRAVQADVLALGATGATPPNLLLDALTELRAQLPAAVQLWVGGQSPALQRRLPEGVRRFASLQDIAEAVASARVRAHP